MSSARSVSIAAMPAPRSASLSPISCVAIDLTLTTSSAPVARTRSVTIRLASSASRAQCTVPPRAVTCSSSCTQVAVEVGQHVVLDRRAGRAQLAAQSGSSATTAAALGADGRGGVAQVVPQLRVGQRVVRPRPGTARSAAQVSRAPTPLGRPRNVTTPSSVAARISARCRVRVPACSRPSPPPMCIRQDASPAAQTSAPVPSDVAHLVGQHRGRHVGVLQRERAAEAAALLGVGQLDQVEPAHRAQQLAAAGRRPAAAAASGRSGGR